VFGPSGNNIKGMPVKSAGELRKILTEIVD
jgi:hypothetical protein